MRIGIVGARRGRQGIGEHVAWRLARLGATVPAIVGTRPETLAEAQRNLRERRHLETRGYLSLPDMLRTERLDAVALCSPDRCHREQLHVALDHGLHVLCEKPLVFDPARDSADDARPLVAGFRTAGKVLMVNEQWPCTLAWFRGLFPRDAAPPANRLEMLLCPGETGAAMIPNALPHVLSLLVAVAPPGGEARDIEVRATQVQNGEATELDVRFVYIAGDTAVSAVRDTGTVPSESAVHDPASIPPPRTRGLTPPARLADSTSAPCLRDSVVNAPQHTTHVRAVFRQVAAQPRPAGYAIDGRAVRRTIDVTDYSMALVEVDDLFARDDDFVRPADRSNSSRRIAIPDPLQVLLEDFVARISSAEPPRSDSTLLDRLRLLDAVYRAACEQLATDSGRHGAVGPFAIVHPTHTAETAVAPSP